MFRRSWWSTAAVALAAVGCHGVMGPGGDPEHHSDVSFELDGRSYRASYVSGSVADGAFQIDAAEYDGFGQVSLWVNDWPGSAGTFDLVTGDDNRAGEYAPSGWFAEDPSFSTARYGGSGRVILSSPPFCWSSTGRDPFTGVSGTSRRCTLEGRFEFTARNAQGAQVRITRGRFRVTGPDAREPTG